MNPAAYKRFNALKVKGAPPGEFSGICYDSRQAKPGYAFVALRGALADGHDYVQDAISRGASTVVLEKEPASPLPPEVTAIYVTDTREALSRMAEYYYDFPSKTLGLIGVTGTNGKTTITYLLSSILAEAGKKWGRIGTIGYDIMGKTYASVNTTPESADLQRMMRTILDEGGEYCLLEVSSHALDQGRVERLCFRCAIFTNLSQDHLDYHGDMETYFSAKSLLFTKHSPGVSVINVDDPWSERLLGMIKGKVVTYGLKNPADVTVKNVTMSLVGANFTLSTPQGQAVFQTKLAGVHNLYNIMAAAAAAAHDGIPLKKIAAGVGKCQGAPGRFEKVDIGQPFAVIVDYAHTPDALENLLAAAKQLNPGRIVTLFGCGGDRDKSKRPLMGRVAWDHSDLVVVTSDNPRTEDPEKIISDILIGIPRHEREGRLLAITDRSEAINKTISMSKKGDVVLIAGKGHEDYQIIGGEKIHFDDREEALKALRKMYGHV